MKNIFSFIAAYFQPVKASQLVDQALNEYERQLISHLDKSAYHAKMAEYYSESLTRLQAFKPLQVQ